MGQIQGWGVPAVQYRQSTPVLGNLGPVTDWRSYFYDSGIVRTCTEDLYRVPGPPICEDWWTGTGGHLRNFPIPGQITEIQFCPKTFCFRSFCLKSFLKDHRIFCQLNRYPGEGATPMHLRPISDGTSCVICSDATINARFLPCGHDSFCLVCARRILEEGAIQEYGELPQVPRCPLCREFAFVVEPYTRPPTPPC